MPDAVYRLRPVLCRLVVNLPLGTNLGLLPLLWMRVSGRLLAARGAVLPGLRARGLSPPATRRAWAARGQGRWTRAGLLARWAALVAAEGRWQPPAHGGDRPVAVEVTGFGRPRLRGGPTSHDHGAAGKALPALPVGLSARVGSAGSQRLALPLAFVRADAADPQPGTHARLLVRAAVRQGAAADALVLEAGCGLALRQEEGAARDVVRRAQNRTFRRATPPPDGGRGRPPTRGVVVRPLPRTSRGQPIPATPPDRRATWQAGGVVLRAAVWDDLALPDAAPDSPAFRVIALHDPRHRAPLLLATPLALPARTVRDCYVARWPIEQLPRAAKQLRGAARQFVPAPETCQRLPELSLLAGAILRDIAATTPAIPTGFWDRTPPPPPGRRRRLLVRTPFPHDVPLPARIREQAAPTAHLPTGISGHRRRGPTAATPPETLKEAA